VKKFRVVTDHKNLEYFMKPRMLNERQVRWSLILGKYNMEILYRPGKQNIRADALSRREQDLPANANDYQLQKRLVQVLKPTASCYEEAGEGTDILAMSARIRALPAVTQRIDQGMHWTNTTSRASGSNQPKTTQSIRKHAKQWQVVNECSLLHFRSNAQSQNAKLKTKCFTFKTGNRYQTPSPYGRLLLSKYTVQ
jgi:hypothetical protein